MFFNRGPKDKDQQRSAETSKEKEVLTGQIARNRLLGALTNGMPPNDYNPMEDPGLSFLDEPETPETIDYSKHPHLSYYLGNPAYEVSIKGDIATIQSAGKDPMERLTEIYTEDGKEKEATATVYHYVKVKIKHETLPLIEVNGDPVEEECVLVAYQYNRWKNRSNADKNKTKAKKKPLKNRFSVFKNPAQTAKERLSINPEEAQRDAIYEYNLKTAGEVANEIAISMDDRLKQMKTPELKENLIYTSVCNPYLALQELSELINRPNADQLKVESNEEDGLSYVSAIVDNLKHYADQLEANDKDEFYAMIKSSTEGKFKPSKSLAEFKNWVLEKPKDALQCLNKPERYQLDFGKMALIISYLENYAEKMELSDSDKEQFHHLIELAKKGELETTQDTEKHEVFNPNAIVNAAHAGDIATSGSYSPEMQQPGKHSSTSPEMMYRLNHGQAPTYDSVSPEAFEEFDPSQAPAYDSVSPEAFESVSPETRNRVRAAIGKGANKGR